MKQINDKEIKSISNEILLYIKDLCDRHKIKYFLAYGTLIGAVRHKGFIPWDDDIDILMFRDDYERFRDLMIKEHGQYSLIDPLSSRDYYIPLPKVIDSRTCSRWPIVRKPYNYGVWVDIFILDEVPANLEERQKLFKKLYKLQEYYEIALYKTVTNKSLSFIQQIYRKLRRLLVSWVVLLGPKFFANKLLKLSAIYRDTNSDFVCPMHFSPYNREKLVLNKSMFATDNMVEFEGHMHPAPANIDIYLKAIYGDYMQLPPIEKRVSNHSYTFYYKDKVNGERS